MNVSEWEDFQGRAASLVSLPCHVQIGQLWGCACRNSVPPSAHLNFPGFSHRTHIPEPTSVNSPQHACLDQPVHLSRFGKDFLPPQLQIDISSWDHMNAFKKVLIEAIVKVASAFPHVLNIP